MMRYVFGMLAVAALAVAPASADYYVGADWNGWDPAGNLMNPLGGGLYGLDVMLGANERHEFKVTQGDWGWSVPGSGNSWLFTDMAGHAGIVFDENFYEDGWYPQQYRIAVDIDPGTWTAVGDWQGWDNANPATAMAPLGGGVYYLEQMLDVGWHEYKAVLTGSWDAIGADGRSVNAATFWFECTEGSQLARMWVNAAAGTMKVEVVPEPATLITLMLGGVALLRRR